MVPATIVSMPSAVMLSWSLMLCGPSAATTVTVLACAGKPRSTWSGSHGLAASFSATQKVNLAGVPAVAMSPVPGIAAPMLTAVQADFCCNRAVEDQEGRAGVRRRLRAVEVVRLLGQRLDGEQHQREILGPAARHHRVGSEP